MLTMPRYSNQNKSMSYNNTLDIYERLKHVSDTFEVLNIHEFI